MDKTPSQEMLAHAEKLCAQRGVRLTQGMLYLKCLIFGRKR